MDLFGMAPIGLRRFLASLLRSQKLLLTAALLFSLAACSDQSQPKPKLLQTGTVAVMDLQRVAEETGLTRQISNQLSTIRTDLQNQLSEVQLKLNTDLIEKQENFGDKPSAEQRQELNQLFVAAKRQLQQAQQQAEGALAQQRANLADQLYDVLRPYAKSVAKQKGMNVVLLKSQALVFDHSPETDITDEVIAAVLDAKATGSLKVKTDATDSGESPSQDKGTTETESSAEPAE
jgi:Skp family chaperone for outer membrane proteins